MTKDEESAILLQLSANDTYFADTFSDSTETMVENIRNDHPLLLGTDFYKLSKKNVLVIKETLKTAINALTAEIELMEKDPNTDSAYIIQLKEKCIDLIFAENRLRN